MIKRVLKVLFTLLAVAVAGILAWRFYTMYEEHPWTRDGQVRAYVVGIAARVNGPMVNVYVKDNQWVEAGDPLFEIDPTDFEKEVRRGEAALEKSKTVAANLKLEVERRRGLVSQNLISLEDFQSFEAQYLEALADIAVDEAELELAKLNLSYTKVKAPVSGYITNLQVTSGTYVHTGQSLMALVDASSFWISAYFRETDLQTIKPGDRVRIVMMGDFFEPFHGEVESISWGIYRADGASNQDTQLPVVKPTVDWVRLAQRFPVRIRPLDLPDNIQLRVGQTVSVLVDPISEDDYEKEHAVKSTAETYPKMLTDGRGAKVTIEQEPQKIISLAPSTTQWMHRLGVENRLIGVTEHCKVEDDSGLERYPVYPEPSYEAIVVAAPDLIITADIADAKHVTRLRELGLKVLVLNHDGYEGVLRDGQTLGAALNQVNAADDVLEQLKQDRAAVESSVDNREAAPRALLALSTKLDFVAGQGSYAGNLLELAGAENAVEDTLSMWPQLNREAVLKIDPDVIVITHDLSDGAEPARDEALSSLRNDPIWRQLSAVQQGRVSVVDAQLMNVPGPQIGEALKALHEAIYLSGD